MTTLILLHFLSCALMTGIIWVIQILVYPLFQFIGEKEFSFVHEFHMKQITWIVAPLMVLELATGILLVYRSGHELFWWNLASVLSLWALTALINVPTHHRLKHNCELSKRNLSLRNWPRTWIWTSRSLFLISFLLNLQSTEAL